MPHLAPIGVLSHPLSSERENVDGASILDVLAFVIGPRQFFACGPGRTHELGLLQLVTKR